MPIIDSVTQVEDEATAVDFEHFLLTRFNVRMAIYGHHTDGWLEPRLELFKKYALPSVQAQTNQSFTWVIYFDAESPDWLRREIAILSPGSFTPVYVDGVFSSAVVASDLESRSRAPYLITTRMDNDDAVAFEFVDMIQAQFKRQTLEFINLVSGAQLRHGKVYRRPYTKNPFLSLVERRGPSAPKSVFVVRHFDVDKVAPVTNIRAKHPLWLQVIHGDNILNEVVGLRTRVGNVAPHFGCEVGDRESTVGYALDRASGSLRIGWRLLRKPRRLRELVRSAGASRGGGSVLSPAPGRTAITAEARRH